MGFRKILIFGALFVSLLAVGIADAQFDESGLSHQLIDVPSPRFGPRKVETADSTRPLAAPGVFDYDTRAFAPLEFTNNKELEPNKGFFFTLDRIYASVTRPNVGGDTGAIQTGSEYIWGTRYNVGWFSDEDEGWQVTFQDQEGAFFTNGRDVSVSNPMLVNVTLNTVEVNRIFRQALSHGGYLEPYIGLRYTNITDKTLEDTTQFLGGALGAAPTQVGNRFRQEVTNNAIGIQAGGRYNVRRGRWRTTTDGALATSYNQQRYFATDIANSPTAQAINETFINDQSFVPIIDGQFEVAYNISRDISLRIGAQAVYTWNGIARANTLTTTLNPNSTFGIGGPGEIVDDNHVAAGFLFGVEWRR